jgi:tetratricopeptide (TPR) repeat protein
MHHSGHARPAALFRCAETGSVRRLGEGTALRRSDQRSLLRLLRLSAVLLLVAAASAHAPPARAQATESTDEEARGLFAAATAAFEDGRFQAALNYFQSAYELSERPELLFNLAATLERLRRDAEAIDHYERYLAALPAASNRRFVESRLATLRSVVITPRTGTQPPTDTQLEPPPDTTQATVVPPASDVAASALTVTPTGDPLTREDAPPQSHRRRRRAIIITVVAVVVAGAATGLAIGLSGNDDPTLYTGDFGAGGVVATLVRR